MLLPIKAGVHWSSTNLSWGPCMESNAGEWDEHMVLQHIPVHTSHHQDNNATSQWKLPAKAETPLRAMYRPELDLSPELGHEDASTTSPWLAFYIGLLNWDELISVWRCP